MDRRGDGAMSSDTECEHRWPRIYPPDADGWQRESCADCDVTLDWLGPLGPLEVEL